MRAPCALLTLLTISACGGANDGDSASGSAQTSDATATTQAAETGLATTPTTTAEPATTANVSDGGTGTETGPAPTTGPGDTSTSTGTASTGTASTDPASTGTDTTADTTGADPGTTAGTDAVSASESDTGAGDSSTGPGCPEGQDGCPCGPGGGCDPGLACAQGVCGPAPKCGDGKLDPGEACDDGGSNGNGAACKLDCSKQVCGDGFVGAGEQCDDGNQVDGDGCQKTCVKTPAPAKDACGYDSDGVWFQIDYSNAFSVSNPSYTYSPTPGWGEAQWAPTGKDWPYAVDLFNNASVVNDQIGKVALLNGTNKAVRVYFGLAGLNYTYATVCVEGRSYSVGSSVTFLVQEAKSKCGDYGMMANDWSVHATGVDMADCFIPGDEFQAVQVQPSGGSGALSLKRLRVTLHGASY
jgi:cysteine-rich repeat protein